jgi:hypothetical protein
VWQCKARLAAERAAIPAQLAAGAEVPAEAVLRDHEASCAAAVVLVPLVAALAMALLAMQVFEVEVRTQFMRKPLRRAARGAGACLLRWAAALPANLHSAAGAVAADGGVGQLRGAAEQAARAQRVSARAAHGLVYGADADTHAAELEGTSRADALWVAGHSSTLGNVYLSTHVLRLALLGAGAVIDLSAGWTPATSICYALGSFFGGVHMLYYLVGFSKTGPLLTMIVGAVLSEFTRWLFVFVPLVVSFAFAFFSLNLSHSWIDLINHDVLYAFQTATVSDKAETVLNQNTGLVEGQANSALW